jgi:hypothetical protein
LESLKGKDNSEDLGVDGRTILKWIVRKAGMEVVDWFHLAQDKGQ